MKNIFISSTFRDMQGERDMVQEKVIPALRNEARKYGENVSAIDLRWGVDTSTLESEEGSAKVLSVCLDEIERSHPYMLIFLGERYGWIPESKIIEKAIKKREDKYQIDDYEKSVTALEIEYGALSEKYGDLENCIVCFREPMSHLLDASDREVYQEQSEKGMQKICALKERMKRELGDRIIYYRGIWDEANHAMADFRVGERELSDVLIEKYIELFQKDWEQYKDLCWQEKEQLAFGAFLEQNLHSFTGREELIEEYYINSCYSEKPMILQGEAGLGKTALMCKLIERVQKEGRKAFYFFAGKGSVSDNAESLVKQMVYYLEEVLGEAHEEVTAQESVTIWEERKSEYEKWMERFRHLSYRCNCVYFFIDGLDLLLQDEHVRKLDFLVYDSPYIQMIASCSEKFVIPEYIYSDVYKIPSLNKKNIVEVIEKKLEEASRNAYEVMVRAMQEKESIENPLYLSLLIQRLNMMDGEDLYSARTEQEIIDLGIRIIKAVPEQMDAAFVFLLDNGIRKISEADQNLQEVLYYLAASRNGLRMQDLQGIFALQNKSFDLINFSRLMKYLDTFFYVRIDDRIDFSHKEIRKGLRKELEDIFVYEKQIGDYIQTLEAGDSLWLQEGMYYARVQRNTSFAQELIWYAYTYKNKVLLEAIKEAAFEDEGEFYKSLLEVPSLRWSTIYFLQEDFQNLFNDTYEEVIIRERVGKKVNDYYLSICKTALSGDAEGLLEEQDKILWGVPTICRKLADAYRDEGDIESALDFYEMATMNTEKLYEVVQETEETFLILLRNNFHSYSNMGNILITLARGGDALYCYSKALNLSIDISMKEHNPQNGLYNIRNMAWSYCKLGNTYAEIEEWDKAQAYYREGMEYIEKLHDIRQSSQSLMELIQCYINYGQFLAKQKKMEEALKYLEDAYLFTREITSLEAEQEKTYIFMQIHNGMGDVYRGLEEWEDALAEYDSALHYGEKWLEEKRSPKSLSALSECYKKVKDLYEECNDIENALIYAKAELQCDEVVHEVVKSRNTLIKLENDYDDIGDLLNMLGREQEAGEYYQMVSKLYMK